MYSNIEDLLHWAKSGTGDSLLSAATVEARHDYQPLSPLSIPYGLGQFVFPEQLPSLPAFVGGFYGHDGDTIGFSTWAFRNDELGISFASNLNSCSSDLPFAEALGIFMEEFALANANTTGTNPPTSVPTRMEAPTTVATSAADCMFSLPKYAAVSLPVLLQNLW